MEFISEQERAEHGGLLRDFIHTARVFGEYALLGVQDLLISVDDNLQELPDD